MIRPLLGFLCVILFASGGCGPDRAPSVRLDVPNDTIALFQLRSSGPEVNPALTNLGKNGRLAPAEFAALCRRPDVNSTRLLDAPITAGNFDVDTTAEVRYNSLAPDGSPLIMVSPRRSGCHFFGSVSGPGPDGQRFINGSLSVAVVRPWPEKPLGVPPPMDSSQLQVSAHVGAGAPFIVGGFFSSETTSDAHGSSTLVDQDVLIVIIGGAQ